MNYNDIIMSNLIITNFGKINTGYFVFDIMYVLIASSIIMYIFNPEFKKYVFKKIEGYLIFLNNMNRIRFSSSQKATSERYKAIMFYISKKTEPSIKILSEILEMKYNNKTDDYEDRKLGLYRVDQDMIFYIDTNINGRIYYEEKEKTDYGTKIIYTEYIFLEISSKKLKLVELEEWVEIKLKEYEDFLQSKSCNKQLLFEVSYNPKDKNIDIEYCEWKSNVTFENRFFTNKNNIFEKIKFFIDNPDWYKKRGIPYTLGFLLWGAPGCGKTGFIKALMNYTGRHGISIKLNNMFDMNKLREIIYNDMISNFKIPQNKKILIFEDIDCMSNVVKERDNIEKKISEIKLENASLLGENKLEELLHRDTNYNNNLSYFLNIIDGLQECPGRIIIMTTNKPQELDKALIRPGRIDYNIHFTLATLKDIKDIIEFYWGDKINKNIPDNIDNKLSHAEVVNMCRISSSIEETINKIINNL